MRTKAGSGRRLAACPAGSHQWRCSCSLRAPCPRWPAWGRRPATTRTPARPASTVSNTSDRRSGRCLDRRRRCDRARLRRRSRRRRRSTPRLRRPRLPRTACRRSSICTSTTPACGGSCLGAAVTCTKPGTCQTMIGASCNPVVGCVYPATAWRACDGVAAAATRPRPRAGRLRQRQRRWVRRWRRLRRSELRTYRVVMLATSASPQLCSNSVCMAGSTKICTPNDACTRLELACPRPGVQLRPIGRGHALRRGGTCTSTGSCFANSVQYSPATSTANAHS